MIDLNYIFPLNYFFFKMRNINCAFKDILRSNNFQTNLERDNDSLKFVPNHFCSPPNSAGKMSQNIICYFLALFGICNGGRLGLGHYGFHRKGKW